ncbi:MAG TPA: Holliday junction resolvase RuvX [Candidatus Acidoferrales bacterium]|nr:Holliday junction resolvase RuvX [Candidatus Acidoferrales bacterium]
MPSAAHNSGVSAAGRVLAIDYGRRRLGLALSDEGRLLARPLETLVRVNRQADLARLRRIVREQGVAQLVVGLPLRLDGTAGDMAAEARAFAARVGKAVRLPVALVDERLTSWEASEGPEANPTKGSFAGRRRGRADAPSGGGAASKAHRAPDGVDSLAAALILEEFLRREAGTR